MQEPVSRRQILRTKSALAAAVGTRMVAGQTGAAGQRQGGLSDGAIADPAAWQSDWHRRADRIWLSGDLWSNPMEDWQIRDGGLECTSAGGFRNVHLITREITKPAAGFAIAVTAKRLTDDREDRGVGFRIGLRSDIQEYRSSCFLLNGGVTIGITGDRMQIGPRTRPLPEETSDELSGPGVRLVLTAAPDSDGVRLTLTVFALGFTGRELGSMDAVLPEDKLRGNLSLAHNFTPWRGGKQGNRFRFEDWEVSGAGLTADDDRAFGPILWSMYTLDDSRGEDGTVLRLSAQTGPLGKDDNTVVTLETGRDGNFSARHTAELDPDAWTAIFRIPNWDGSAPSDFRLTYRMKNTAAPDRPDEFIRVGTIRAVPEDRPVKLAALTCQKDYGFPYAPVAENVLKSDPDLVYFSGDQLYEDHGGFGLIRRPADRAILNYLRKFYMFGWAFGDVMRDRPTLCIPDDHDVFQGNIWGEGGKAMELGDSGASSKGGYIEPARMVNVVHRTCAGHHPEAFDPTPCEQNISVYYGEVVYGGVSFAVLGDRQFKSGPDRVETGSGRADHVTDPDLDPTLLDLEGLELLGERQEKFLQHWAGDWRGHSMKVLLSQTVFAAVATHHGGYDNYLVADLDSGGWPQTARNRAVRILREAKCLHVNGDQHLTTLVQYGADAQRDSSWSFCVPAISAGYPRWWRPDEMQIPHTDRPSHGLPNTGRFTDSFGNHVYLYAVGNPEVGRKKNRYELAHQKGSGFGLVTIDPEKRTYLVESFRFLIDAADGDPENQFPGWPVLIHQDENGGQNRIS